MGKIGCGQHGTGSLFPGKGDAGSSCTDVRCTEHRSAFWICVPGWRRWHQKDGEGREQPVLAGMYTSQANAESLESLFAYLQSHEELDGKELILYGNIPGLSYYLDRPCAIRTSWPDLDTSSYEDLKSDLNALSTKIALTDIDKPTPLVILAADAQEGDKLSAIRDFMEEYSYQLAFQNERFLVYW